MERCYDLLRREAPVASDLRFIVSVLRVLSELERIGDLSLAGRQGGRRARPAPRRRGGVRRPPGDGRRGASSATGLALRAWATMDLGLATGLARRPHDGPLLRAADGGDRALRRSRAGACRHGRHRRRPCHRAHRRPRRRSSAPGCATSSPATPTTSRRRCGDGDPQELPRPARRRSATTSCAWPPSSARRSRGGPQALLDGDLAAGQALIDADDDLDVMALDVEERCYQLLALQQPMAGDLRPLVTAIRSASEIERSGDLVVNVAKGAQRLTGAPVEPRVRGLLQQMSDEALALMRHVDRRLRRRRRGARRPSSTSWTTPSTTSTATTSPRSSRRCRGGTLEIQAAVQLALVGRYYERIGDHAVNVGERVCYMVSGWMPEHHHRPRRETGEPVAVIVGAAVIADTVQIERSVLVVGGVVVGVGSLVALVLRWRARRRRCVRRVTTPPSGSRTRRRPIEHRGLDANLGRLERAVDRAALRANEMSVAEARLQRAMEAIPQGVVICDETGDVVYRNRVASKFRSARHGEALVAAAVEDLLAGALGGANDRRTLDLFGPPRRALVLASYPARRRAPHRRRPRRHRRRHRAAPARGRPPRLRRQHQPRAQDAGRRPRAARRDPARRERPRRRPPPRRAHAARGPPGRTHDRRPARPVAHRGRGGRTRGAGPGPPRRRRGRRAGAIGGRAARDARSRSSSRPSTSPSSATAASSCRPSTTCSTTPRSTASRARRSRCVTRVEAGRVEIDVRDHGVGIPTRDLERDLRALLPGRPGPQPGDRRHRPRPRHRPPRRRQPRRRVPGRVPRRRGLDVHPVAPGRDRAPT